ncbi:alpha/beta hydrolase [Streptomyces sp. NPDC001700]
MDYATLKSLKPSEFEDAASGYLTVSNMAGQAKDDIENRIAAKLQSALEGNAAEEAVKQLQKLAANFQYTQVECGVVSTGLNALASELQAAKNKLDNAIEDAKAEKFTVEADGSVTYPAAGDKVDGKTPDGGTVTGSAHGEDSNKPIDPAGDASDTADTLARQAKNIHPNPNYGKAVAYANRIAQAVYEATEADNEWAPKLRRLKADDDLHVSRYDWVDAQKDASGVHKSAKGYLDGIKSPPKDGTPKENAKWWKGLSDREQADYTAMHPARLGNLDGIPSDIRDDANRTVLAEKVSEYRIRLSQIPEEPTKFKDLGPNATAYTQEWLNWHHKHEADKNYLQSSLNGMDKIQERINETGRGDLPRAYVLGFSAKDDGRAIIANGNPDTADHTAVYVPGTTASLSKVDGDLNRMTELWRAADPMAGGKSVSTITWLGYDAPNSITKDAPFSHYANDGAPAFNKFIDGLNTTHSGSGSHITAIGHSYGTTLIGSAARQGDANVGDVIFAGSPGVQVGHADQMDVPKGHVWNEGADDDFVPALGQIGHGHREFHADTGFDWTVPNDRNFGATQMDVDTSGHSGYWDRDSQSLKNQAKVVTQNYDAVQREKY